MILIDESQSLLENKLDLIVNAVTKGIIRGAVFSYDDMQLLSKAELGRNNPGRLKQMEAFHEESLKARIRTDPQIISFIRNVFRLYEQPRTYIDYSDIDVVYANNGRECDRILEIYQSRDYTYISFSASCRAADTIESSAEGIGIYPHQLIGREYDKVVQVIDDSFYYNEEGELQAKEHPSHEYLLSRLFYRNISRAREKLCIIVLGNMELFDALLMIKEHDYETLSSKYIKHE